MGTLHDQGRMTKGSMRQIVIVLQATDNSKPPQFVITPMNHHFKQKPFSYSSNCSFCQVSGRWQTAVATYIWVSEA